jgi:hypothetical protein
VRGAECPTSDAAARAGGTCGPVGRSSASWSRFGLFAGSTTQAVAFELDAVGIVNDAIQDGVSKRGIAEHGRVPQFLAGSCLISRSPPPIISFLDIGFRWCRSGRHAAPRTWL